MRFSSLNECFSLISFSYSIISIRVIRRECAPFRSLPLNSFICKSPPSLNINGYITEALWMFTQKCNGEMWFEKISTCVMWILRESRYTFASRCWFYDLYFELLHRIFLIFHILMKLFSVIWMRRPIHLALLHLLIPIWPRNWYRVPAMKPLAPISMAFIITLYPSVTSSF